MSQGALASAAACLSSGFTSTSTSSPPPFTASQHLAQKPADLPEQFITETAASSPLSSLPSSRASSPPPAQDLDRLEEESEGPGDSEDELEWSAEERGAPEGRADAETVRGLKLCTKFQATRAKLQAYFGEGHIFSIHPRATKLAFFVNEVGKSSTIRLPFSSGASAKHKIRLAYHPSTLEPRVEIAPPPPAARRLLRMAVVPLASLEDHDVDLLRAHIRGAVLGLTGHWPDEEIDWLPPGTLDAAKRSTAVEPEKQMRGRVPATSLDDVKAGSFRLRIVRHHIGYVYLEGAFSRGGKRRQWSGRVKEDAKQLFKGVKLVDVQTAGLDFRVTVGGTGISLSNLLSDESVKGLRVWRAKVAKLT
ncbi:hypothetical protein JCM3770_001212 [Rhodotorula araucariae]